MGKNWKKGRMKMKKRRHRNLLALFLAATLTLASLPGMTQKTLSAQRALSAQKTLSAQKARRVQRTLLTQRASLPVQRQRDVLCRTDMKENV